MSKMKKSKTVVRGRPLGQATKKGQGSMREQLRAVQRYNRRHSGYTNHKGVEVRPRAERIKRNHMQTVGEELSVIASIYDRARGFVPVSEYMK